MITLTNITPGVALFKVQDESHTLGNLLVAQLQRDPRVYMAGYRKLPHEEAMELRVGLRPDCEATPDAVVKSCAVLMHEEFGSIVTQLKAAKLRGKTPELTRLALAPYLGVNMATVHMSFIACKLTSDDKLLDLQCCDGRISIVAASTAGCASTGIDERKPLLSFAATNAIAAEVGSLCVFHAGNPDVVPIPDEYTIVTTFSQPPRLISLADRLEKWLGHANHRVITYRWGIHSVNESFSQQHLDIEPLSRLQLPNTTHFECVRSYTSIGYFIYR